MSEEVTNNDQNFEAQEIQNEEQQDVANQEQEGQEGNDAPQEEVSRDASEPDENVLRLAQEKAGKAIAAQRKAHAQQLENLKRENEALRQRAMAAQQPQQAAQDEPQYDPNRMVYDPVTERYYSFDDPNPAGAALAAQVWHKQQAELKSKQNETKQLYDDLATKIIAGTAAYEGYDESLATFQTMGNDDIASSLLSVNDPAKIVNYLGKNPHEIERLLQLRKHEIVRHVIEIEKTLTTHKKVVSNAKAPVSDFGQPPNTMRPPELQSYEEREAFWRQRINNQ